MQSFAGERLWCIREKGGHLVTRMHSEQFSLKQFFETEYRVAGSDKNKTESNQTKSDRLVCHLATWITITYAVHLSFWTTCTWASELATQDLVVHDF